MTLRLVAMHGKKWKNCGREGLRLSLQIVEEDLQFTRGHLQPAPRGPRPCHAKPRCSAAAALSTSILVASHLFTYGHPSHPRHPLQEQEPSPPSPLFFPLNGHFSSLSKSRRGKEGQPAWHMICSGPSVRVRILPSVQLSIALT